MFNVTLNIGKKRRIVVAIIVMLMIVILFEIGASLKKTNQQQILGQTNEQRIEFIHLRGHNVIDNPINVKTITIPQNFSDVYNNYNSLQIKAGFNLELYKGKEAVLYTYSALGYDTQVNVNLLVCDGVIIGGDISSVELNGFMNPL